MAQTVSRARPLLDPLADYLMMLTSFNEFHEDTQIEPVVVDKLVAALVIANEGSQTAYDNLKVTDKALHIWNDARNGYLDTYTKNDTDLTQGLTYEAYYDLYLNILRRLTVAPFYTNIFATLPVLNKASPKYCISLGAASSLYN